MLPTSLPGGSPARDHLGPADLAARRELARGAACAPPRAACARRARRARTSAQPSGTNTRYFTATDRTANAPVACCRCAMRTVVARSRLVVAVARCSAACSSSVKPTRRRRPRRSRPRRTTTTVAPHVAVARPHRRPRRAAHDRRPPISRRCTCGSQPVVAGLVEPGRDRVPPGARRTRDDVRRRADRHAARIVTNGTASATPALDLQPAI